VSLHSETALRASVSASIKGPREKIRLCNIISGTFKKTGVAYRQPSNLLREGNTAAANVKPGVLPKVAHASSPGSLSALRRGGQVWLSAAEAVPKLIRRDLALSVPLHPVKGRIGKLAQILSSTHNS
jgi:hypothetical protein